MSANLTLPANPAAERAVLGAVLVDGSAFYQVADRLTEKNFYELKNAAVWSAYCALAKAGKPIDLITASQQLEAGGSLEEAGGLSYVASLAEGLPDVVNVEHYADVVSDLSAKREVISLCMRLSDQATRGTEASVLISGAVDSLTAITTGGSEDVRQIGDIAGEVAEALERRSNQGYSDLTTGFYDLDHILIGLEPEDLILLAARPGVGKTALAGNILSNVAKAGKSCLLASLEMSATSIVKRILSTESHMNHRKFRVPIKGDANFWAGVTMAQDKVADWKLFISDRPGINPMSLLAQCRRLKAKHGLDLVIVDYVQLMEGEGENGNARVGKITRGLKLMAKDLRIPVIALSQLSRDAAKANRPPGLTDLRDSGCLEQDADVVVLMHPTEQDPNTLAVTLDLIVAKHRSGETGTAKVVFQPSTLAFQNYAKEIA